MTTLFFYKNVIFPTQAEYSYFSADFGLRIFLYYSYYSFDILYLFCGVVYVFCAEHCTYVLHVPGSSNCHSCMS